MPCYNLIKRISNQDLLRFGKIKEGINVMSTWKELLASMHTNRNCIESLLLVLVACLSAPLSVQALEGDLSQTYLFSDQELDNLLAPIALYPDPLLAEMLPASTYPTEIADAAAWLQSGGDISGIDGQNWDESVKAVAHYPEILATMADDMDWTANLGDAFLNQQEDVTRAIQRLRAQARAEGNLMSTNEQSVIVEDGSIEIIPAEPEYIGVPEYDPSVVYDQSPAYGAVPFIVFYLVLPIGDWLHMDFDWRHHHVIYHGWNRPGWVNNGRPYVHVRNVYISRSRPNINQVWRHDVSRGDPDKYRASRPVGARPDGYERTREVRGRTVTPLKPPEGAFRSTGNTVQFSNRGKESLNAARQKPLTTTGISQQPVRRAPIVSSGIAQPGSARGTVQPAKPPSSVFGGYRGADETRAQSRRGGDSRQSSVGVGSSAAPANRGSAPAGRTSTGGKEGFSR